MKTRTEQLKEAYRLEAHPEGGWFAEVYTAPFEKDGRELAGSIHRQTVPADRPRVACPARQKNPTTRNMWRQPNEIQN